MIRLVIEDGKGFFAIRCQLASGKGIHFHPIYNVREPTLLAVQACLEVMPVSEYCLRFLETVSDDPIQKIT